MCNWVCKKTLKALLLTGIVGKCWKAYSYRSKRNSPVTAQIEHQPEAMFCWRVHPQKYVSFWLMLDLNSNENKNCLLSNDVCQSLILKMQRLPRLCRITRQDNPGNDGSRRATIPQMSSMQNNLPRTSSDYPLVGQTGRKEFPAPMDLPTLGVEFLVVM
jgi:hypothetical protein